MTGINDLAPETLANVFRLMGEPRSKERVKALLAASLVCSGWTNAAQAELWDSIKLNSMRGQVRKFALSRANKRRMRTREVKVDGLGGDEGTLLALVLSCVDVETLELKGEKEYRRGSSVGGSDDDFDDYDEGGRRVPVFPVDVLGHFNLDKLTELSIGTFKTTKSDLNRRKKHRPGIVEPPPLKIRFRLTKLSIESQLYSLYLRKLFRRTITSLTLDFSSRSNGGIKKFLSAVEPIASHVKEVKFNDLQSLESMMATSLSGSHLTDRLEAFWARFTNVVSLKCDFGSLEYLKDSPTTLKYLEVYEKGKEDHDRWGPGGTMESSGYYDEGESWFGHEKAFRALVNNQSSLKVVRMEFFFSIHSEGVDFHGMHELCQKKGIAFRSKRLNVW